jgi:hypothetical protein
MPAGADGIVRLTAYYSYKNQQMQHNFWGRVKPTDPSPTWQALTDKMVDDYMLGIWARIRLLTVTSMQLTALQAQTLNPRGTAQTLMGYTNEFGAYNGDGMPPHDAAVLSLYTAYPGRRVHGRLYVSGLPESIQNQGELTTDGEASLKNLGDWLVQMFGEGGASPHYWYGVYSRANGATRMPGPPPYISYSPLAHVPWTRRVANKVLGTQRHRKIGRGA